MMRSIAARLAVALAAFDLPHAAVAQVLEIGEEVAGSTRVCRYEVAGQPFSYSTASGHTCRTDVRAIPAVLTGERRVGSVTLCEYRAGGRLISTRTAAAGEGCRLTVLIPDFAAPASYSRPLSGGAPVRVRTGARSYRGRLLRLYPDSLALVRVLAPDRDVDYRAPVVDTAVISLASLRQLEQGLGRHGHAVEGGVIAMAGVVAGTLLAMTDNPGAWFNGSLLVLPAALTGLVIGAAVRTETWEPVDLVALRNAARSSAH